VSAQLHAGEEQGFIVSVRASLSVTDVGRTLAYKVLPTALRTAIDRLYFAAPAFFSTSSA